MSNVVALPTASQTHIAVRKAGRFWRVDLVTPITGSTPLRTELARSEDKTAAINFAKDAAVSKKRPLRLPRGEA